MTSSRVPTSAVLLLALLLAASPASADQKDDLYNKGTAAVNNGDSIAARDAFCAIPSDFKDAGAQCATYKAAADRTLNRYKINFGEGMSAMQAGDYATAEAKFRNVKAGDYADQAKQKLQEIVKLKQQKAEQDAAAQQNAALEGQMKQRLDQGTNAWNSGDFNTAKSALGGVTGSHAAEAQAILGKIRSYENAMQQGNAFNAAKDYGSAKNAFAEALRINPSGPGNPADLMAKAAVAASIPTPNTNNASNNSTNFKPAAPPVKQIDVAAYLQDGHRAMDKGDFKKAKRFFQEVLVQDIKNQDANDAMAVINSKNTGKSQASDADPQLSRYISLFYEGSYTEAEQLLITYANNNTNTGKLGLANFYLGASMLTRYYLSGGTDDSLRREARNKFKAAKTVDGFKAPEKYISPKIMKAFQEAS